MALRVGLAETQVIRTRIAWPFQELSKGIPKEGL